VKPNDLVFWTSTESRHIAKVRTEVVPVAHWDLVAGPTGSSSFRWGCGKAFQLGRERRAIDSQRIHMYGDCVIGGDDITHTRDAKAD
jgi:hypothetical protein